MREVAALEKTSRRRLRGPPRQRRRAASAHFNLGVLYIIPGMGVAKDIEAAAAWFAKAAAQGRVKAQFNLGVVYERTARASYKT